MTLGCYFGMQGFDCSLLWVSMIGIFFIAAMARKQINDLLNMNFSMIGATVGGIIVYNILIFATHNLKWALLSGIVALFIAGFLSASFMPDAESEGGY